MMKKFIVTVLLLEIFCIKAAVPFKAIIEECAKYMTEEKIHKILQESKKTKNFFGRKIYKTKKTVYLAELRTRAYERVKLAVAAKRLTFNNHARITNHAHPSIKTHGTE